MTDTPISEPADATHSGDASGISPASKPSRNPVEKLIVRGVIIAGLIVVVIEARARLGYSLSMNAIEKKIQEVEESHDKDAMFNYQQAKACLLFGPAISNETALGNAQRSRTISWYSLVKEYELKLRIGMEDSIVGFGDPEIVEYIPSSTETADSDDPEESDDAPEDEPANGSETE